MFTKSSYILKLQVQTAAAALFKYVWPFIGHQALKTKKTNENINANGRMMQKWAIQSDS